ncbi:hypothetical protein AAC387_Pa02g0615 [Persea americana]
MKPLIDSSQNHQFPLSKPLSYTLASPNAALNTTQPISYEPTSVLDLRSSPASAARRQESTAGIPPVSAALSDEPSSLFSVDEWDDSLLWSLGEKDDSAPDLKCIPHFAPPETPNPNLPPFPSSDSFDSSSSHHLIFPDLNPSAFPSPNPCFFSEKSNLCQSPLESPSFDRLQLEQLIQAAECVDSNDLSLAHAILARLNHQLQFPTGKPLQRAAFYFREALESLILRSSSKIVFSPLETLQKISAYKAFSELSPVFQFANFTANQAILEAVSGSGMIHVIDFEIGLGGQWPPLMQEIAMRCRDSARVLPPPSLRITAIVDEESMETKLAGEVLRSFAREIGIRFQIEFVRLARFETLALAAIGYVEGEAVAVSLTPSIFRRIDGPNTAGFLRALRRVSPRIAVFVDSECRRDGAGAPASFRRSFIDGLELYTVLLESLDAAAALGSSAEQIRRIERFLLRPRISRAVAAAGDRTLPPWRELLAGSGMSPIPLSELAESQAECLLRRIPLSGFHVAKRESSMLLCWQGRELVATSAWRCC